MKNNPKTVVITGAESTGKSALTEELSSYFNVPFISEFAREYVENLGRPYTYSDVEVIARMQVQQFYDLKSRGYQLFFTDTWLIITKIWFEEVFQDIPAWIEAEINKAEIDLFLVCDTDLPWVPDNVRENGGEKREYLQKRYIDTINQYGFQYETIRGINDSRFQTAIDSLERNGIFNPNKI